MWQGGQIVDGKTFTVQIFTKWTILDSTFDGHSMMFAIQGNDLIEMFQRDKILSRIGNAVEGMTAAKHPQFTTTTYSILNLVNRCRAMQTDSTISVMARPILLYICHLVFLWYLILPQTDHQTRQAQGS